ncbi:AGE family epimerase/isomerase [Halomonas caseinilytica]|uniref:AGE family epimerase/isomerase n=1 Tax=Halomonas caseinilytica TaxID=438744 RepID=UPI000B270D76|nr:AGE family epimerase/isomerase [Halomonas caseinilytica]
MNIFDPDFLDAHVRKVMAFYHPRAIDPQGGFFHYLRDDGAILDRRHRHLVSSARYVVTYARFARHSGEAEYRHWARHGLDYLERAHFQTAYQGYAWTLADGEVEDDTNHCYGLAFVLLAYAEALKAEVPGAREGLYATHAILQRRFWEPHHGRFADEADRHWRVSGYRGQNANMHACEALISAFEATGDAAFLTQAMTIARAIVGANRDHEHGWIWEHYDAQWQRDLDYNRDDPSHLFRPWGYQVGHQTEWAKLLVMLERYRPEDWLLPTAERLFSSSVAAGWHPQTGGLVYGLDLDGRISDADKYFWVQAESFAAAAMLGERTGRDVYWRWYRRIWDFSWQHMIDHRHGAWYRLLNADNHRYSDVKSPAGKVDYHTMGACQDAMAALMARRDNSGRRGQAEEEVRRQWRRR